MFFFVILHDFIDFYSCSTSSPGGNMVDGLPPAAHNAAGDVELALGVKHGSKNLLQRGILYRHEKIVLRQGRLQARTQESNVGRSDGFSLISLERGHQENSCGRD